MRKTNASSLGLRLFLPAIGCLAILSIACRKAPSPSSEHTTTQTDIQKSNSGIDKESHPASPTTAIAAGNPETRPVMPSPSRVVSEEDEIAKINSDPRLTTTQKALLISNVPRAAAKSKQEIKDRQELVSPPPPDWKPENIQRKLKLTLIPEKTTIHKNVLFRYRLEIQNVGREYVLISEGSRGFIKDGLVGTHWFEFYVTPPGGEERLMANSFGAMFDHKPVEYHEYQFPNGMTGAEKDAAFKKMTINGKAEADARDGLSLFLLPGETLMTRPNLPPPNNFRNLDIDFPFSKPGTYRIKAVYDDRPIEPPTDGNAQSATRILETYYKNHPRAYISPTTKNLLHLTGQDQTPPKDQAVDLKRREEWARDNLGFVESNTVLLEVVP